MSITIEEAQAKLLQLIEGLSPGEEVVITANEVPVAKLVGNRKLRAPRPAPGLGKGSVVYMAADFDEPLDEFKE
jgi:antitoxin (DNA-binding transcriptional repressor) of toxin-antitoxin stability system